MRGLEDLFPHSKSKIITGLEQILRELENETIPINKLYIATRLENIIEELEEEE